MRVSLAFRHNPADIAERSVARPLLAATGPQVILGSPPSNDGLAESIVPGRATLFGPRGAVLNPATGALAVSDTGHHRLMIWRKTPAADYAEADIQIGQKDFASEGRNGKGPIGAATLNVPTGVATDGQHLAVADAWNHRVLIWKTWPQSSNQPADIVLGQKDFSGGLANRGNGTAGGCTLNWCYGVSFIGEGLAVADTGNRRVLIWNRLPEANGQAADLVLGQAGFDIRDEGAGQNSGPVGMRWPHAIVEDGGKLLVADAGNNRIMVWQRDDIFSGAPCVFVLGQKTTTDVEHNRGRYLPDERALNMPYGLCVAGDWLIAADTANSRVIGWKRACVTADAAASALAGQPHFGAKGDNRWRAAVRDSVCWPYSVMAAGGTVAVADSGNNRILLWEIAS